MIRKRKRALTMSEIPIIRAWIATLIITDNCTRQCLGLPLFVAGSKVTADMIVEALKVSLPPDLLFSFSVRGIHFTAKSFQVLISNGGFIHVLIARHRPQSNGIAERFVRTIKEWLKDKIWEMTRSYLCYWRNSWPSTMITHIKDCLYQVYHPTKLQIVPRKCDLYALKSVLNHPNQHKKGDRQGIGSSNWHNP